MLRFVLSAAAAALLVSTPAPASDKDVYRVGIPRSAFREVPPSLVEFAGEPFKALMKFQTGLDGAVVIDPDALNVARQLDAGKLHLGVFLGHEFAWARDKYPDLVPLVCTVPRPREVQAFLLVRHDRKAAHLGDLKGGRLALATTIRDHARLFLDRRRGEEMGEEKFGATERPPTVHDAIHQVIDGEADVTVVDEAAWNYFQKLYPGASQNLRILARSDVFPPTVVAYKKGALPDEIVKRLRDGLMTSHQSSRVAKVMALMKVERFDEVPATFADSLKACLKSYPAPNPDR